MCEFGVYKCMCNKGLQDHPQVSDLLGGLMELNSCACGYDLLQQKNTMKNIKGKRHIGWDPEQTRHKLPLPV